jgi:hypothetical protein
MPTYHSDALAQTERALLGSVLFSKSLWPLTDGLSAEDFSLDSHRRIFGHIAAMFEDQRPVDLVTLAMELDSLNQLESCGGPAYVASLIDDALPENFSVYVRAVRTAAFERQLKCQVRLLNATCSSESPERLSTLRKQTLELNELLDAGALHRDNWQSLFHSYDDVINAPPARFAIEGFLQEEGITLIGGLAGHGKTLCMLAMARALLEGGRLFHRFDVNKTATRVIYLIPEAGLGPFSARLKTFRLQEYVREKRLFPGTLSAPGTLLLTDPRLLDAIDGADVFLDTAVRFMVGDENSTAEQKLFADTLFALQRAGAFSILSVFCEHCGQGIARSFTSSNGHGRVGPDSTTARTLAVLLVIVCSLRTQLCRTTMNRLESFPSLSNWIPSPPQVPPALHAAQTGARSR